MAVNDVYMLSINGSYQGQEYIHTLHFRQEVPIGSPELQVLIDSWQAEAQAEWLAIHPSGAGNYVLNTITASKVCGSLPLPAPVEEAVGAAGTRLVAAQLLAPWLTLVVNERTAFAGRSYRGRFFLSGAGEDDVAGPSFVTVAGLYYDIVDDYVTALEGAYLPGGSDANWALFVYSPTLADDPGIQCQNAGADVTSLSASTVLGTLRSRRA